MENITHKTMHYSVIISVGTILFVNTANSSESISKVYDNRTHGEEVFEFSEKPQVIKEGNNWFITFATKSKCDVTVSILDKDGKVVRHLASGVLGLNAPSSFQQGTLKQKLRWNGKDDHDKPIITFGCKIQTSLGVTPQFSRILCSTIDGVAGRGPIGMAVDSNGNLYIILWKLTCGSSPRVLRV